MGFGWFYQSIKQPDTGGYPDGRSCEATFHGFGRSHIGFCTRRDVERNSSSDDWSWCL